MSKRLNEEFVRKKLAAYLSGRISLRKFNDWFAPVTWNIEAWAPVGLKKLVHEITLRLAEYSYGHWSKADLNDKLLPLATSVEIDKAPNHMTSAGASVRVIPFPRATLAREFEASADGPREVAFG